MVASVPAESVKVPLMVWLPLTLMAAMPAVVLPAKDRLLNVFTPVIVGTLRVTEVVLTL
jgi:hypothetical protein